MKRIRYFPGIEPAGTDNGALSWTMVQGDRTYSFDANNALSDGSVSYTAAGYAQYAGQDGIVDTGGNQNVTITLPSIADVSTITPQQARIDAVVVLDVTAGVFTGTALFKVYAVGSNDPGFGAGKVACLGMLSFGAAASQEYANGFITATPSAIGGSRFELPICTEQNNVKYQYLKLYNVVSNSGQLTYKAFLAVLPEP